MKIRVDYEECGDCEEYATCELLKEMKALVDATTETLQQMTQPLDQQTYADEIQS